MQTSQRALAISTRPGMNLGQDVSSVPPKSATPSTTMSNIHAPDGKAGPGVKPVFLVIPRYFLLPAPPCERGANHPKPRKAKGGGAGRDRTDDLKLAKLPLSQLSYSPLKTRSANIPTPPMSMVGLGGLEPPTSRLSGVRSNHLSYRPIRHAHSVSGKRGDPALWRGLTGKRNEDDGDCLFCQ